jgi:hypothetical protein
MMEHVVPHDEEARSAVSNHESPNRLSIFHLIQIISPGHLRADDTFGLIPPDFANAKICAETAAD